MRGGRLEAVGPRDAVAQLSRGAGSITDLQGRLVVPVSLTGALTWGLTGCSSGGLGWGAWWCR